MRDDDADIVQSILSGNPNDFGKLVEKYWDAAERWAFRHVKDLSDAESIAQEAFAEAYFGLHTLREPKKFAGWLHSIVTNISLWRLRQRRSRVALGKIVSIRSDGPLTQQYTRCETPDPESVLEQKEQEAALHEAISTLPPLYQRVITMFYFDSCSYKEIASQLDISVSIVRNALYRAKQKLRKEMTKNG